MVNVVTSVFKSFEVEGKNGETIRLNEGDSVSFVIETTGEQKIARINKIIGKNEKTKLQVIPQGTDFEEIHMLTNMVEGSLKLYIEE